MRNNSFKCFYVQFQLVLFCAVRSSILIFLPHPFFYWKLKRQDLPRAWNSGSLSVTAWLWHWSRRGWLDFWWTTYCMYYWETKAVVTRCNGILPSRRMWWFVRKIELSRSMTWVHSTNIRSLMKELGAGTPNRAKPPSKGRSQSQCCCRRHRRR